MSNTYTQIHILCVFAVKFRQSVIQPVWKDRLHQYIIAIVRNNGHKVISINNMPDHLHLFFGFRPDQSLSDLMRMVKGESSEWINKEKFTPSVFRWQGGMGRFLIAGHKSKPLQNISRTRKNTIAKERFWRNTNFSWINLKWSTTNDIFSSRSNMYCPYRAKIQLFNILYRTIASTRQDLACYTIYEISLNPKTNKYCNINTPSKKKK